MAFKPHTFETSLQWTAEQGATLNGGPFPIALDAPTAFGGQPDRWTPESLLVGAVEGCTMLTFLAIARRKGLTIHRYQSSASGQLATAEEGEIRFVRFEVRPIVEVGSEDEVERARAIFTTLPKHCFIGTSVVAEPVLLPEILVSRAAA